MVRTCSVDGCLSTSRFGDLKFHRFPPGARCQAWIDACRRPDLKEKSFDKLYNMYVCSLHFEKWMYMKKKLKDAAVPVLKLPFPSASFNPMGTQTGLHTEITSVDTSVMASPSGQTSGPGKDTLDILTKKKLPKELSSVEELKMKKGYNLDAKSKAFNIDRSLQGSASTQTSLLKEESTDGTPEKRKHRSEFISCTEELKVKEERDLDDDVTLDQFLKGCDKFLLPKLSEYVKTQVKTSFSE